MKTVAKREDAAFDNLLRAGIRRAAASCSCPGFDPDLANAYVEKILTVAERMNYQRHLAECSRCRTSVSALSQMVQGDLPSAVRTSHSAPEPVRLVDRLRPAFGLLATPRWGLAAAVVLVAAVSLPFLLSNNAFSPSKSSVVENSTPETNVASSPQSAEPKGDTRGALDSISNSDAPAHTAQYSRATGGSAREPQESGAVAKSAEVGVPATEAPAPPAPREAEAVTRQLQDERQQVSRRSDEGRVASDQAQAPAQRSAQSATEQRNVAEKDQQSQPQLAQVDPKRALRLPESSRDSAHVTPLKPGVVGGVEEKGKEDATAAIKQENAEAPKSEAADSASRSRHSVSSAGTPKLSLRYRPETEAGTGAKLNERSIEGRRFVLLKEFWTDRKYNPDKEVPVVTLVRDSDVYRQVIAKHSTLRKLFTSSQPSDRVIVVYKGTVYKLLPPEK